MSPVPFGRRARLMSAVGPDGSGSNPGFAWTQLPEKSGTDSAFALPPLAGPTGCPKAGVTTAANVTSKRNFRRPTFILPSCLWFRQHLLHDVTPFACVLEGGARCGEEEPKAPTAENGRC